MLAGREPHAQLARLAREVLAVDAERAEARGVERQDADRLVVHEEADLDGLRRGGPLASQDHAHEVLARHRRHVGCVDGVAHRESRGVVLGRHARRLLDARAHRLELDQARLRAVGPKSAARATRSAAVT